jgi:4-amino-4-deoxy-L-arabinose transferase-like glycosyltransferase
VLIVLIFVAALALRSQDLMKPWVGQHNGWGGAMFGTIARNTVHYGLWQTRFGPVVNSGEASPEQFRFYYHYPPLLVWLVSLSYHVFGVHEWSARLVPLGFSLASLALVFVFARRVFSDDVGLAALLFGAVMPIENYYGAHVDVYGSVAVFFSLLAIYGYARWLERDRASDLVLLNLAVALGCLTSWYTYFVVPAIVAHYYGSRVRSGERLRHQLLSVGATAVTVFGLFLVHRRLLLVSEDSEVLGTLLDKLILRMSQGNMFSLWGVKHHARDLIRMYSPPVLALAAMWLIALGVRGARRDLKDRDWLVLLLFAYGFLHNLAFPSLLPGHDYMVVCYAPAIALAAALAFVDGCAYVRTAWGPNVRTLMAGALLAIVVVTGVYMTQRLYASDSNHAYALQRWGETVRRHSAATDVVLAPQDEDQIFRYYVGREMRFGITTPEKLAAALAEKGSGSGYLFAGPVTRSDDFKGVLKALERDYPRLVEDALIIYTIR